MTFREKLAWKIIDIHMTMLPCFQAEPPAIVVATVASLCQMVEKRAFSLGSIKILVIDEVTTLCFSHKAKSHIQYLHIF
jgi:hypothetical protein